MSISKYMYIKNPKYNFFDLSHSNCFTTRTGKVTPNLVMPVYPGDKFKISCTSKTYTAPMITSPFQRIDVSQRFFLVPLRELMELGQFDEYITGGKDLNTTIVRPTINSGTSGFEAGSLMDYLGYATNYIDDSGNKKVVSNKTSAAWALRAYAKIINDYYINPDIEDELSLSLASGSDTTTNTQLFDASWQLDYFTENLPQSGRGSETLIPIGNTAPVVGNGRSLTLSTGHNDGYSLILHSDSVNPISRLSASRPFNVPLGTSASPVSNASDTFGNVTLGVSGNPSVSGLKADLTSVSGLNVDELFALFGIDAYKKLSMRVGSKINEFLLGIWGVTPKDLRLHRSLYLGGRTSPLIIEEVDQTSQTTQGSDGSALATLAGRGVSVNSGSSINVNVDDYGVIIGVYCCMPQAKYFQGTPRWFDYEDYLDWPNPRLAMLGDQITKVGEIFTQGDNSSMVVGSETVTNDTILGFNPKYEELRGIQSSIHGQMKTTLKHYTMAREFSNPPLLNSSFLRGSPSKRIYAVTDPLEDELRVETGFKIHSWRKIPKFGNPAVMRLFS